MRHSSVQQASSHSESLAAKIITEVAAHEGVDPLELDRPLNDVIDVDALESLFSTSRTGAARSVGAVSFSYYGYEVNVTSEGQVMISERVEV